MKIDPAKLERACIAQHFERHPLAPWGSMCSLYQEELRDAMRLAFEAYHADETDEAGHFGPGTTMRWIDGYVVKTKEDWSAHDRAQGKRGYVVVDSKMPIINVMPGCAWFPTPAAARKGIAALELAKRLCPATDIYGTTEVARVELAKQAHAFWMFMELTK